MSQQTGNPWVILGYMVVMQAVAIGIAVYSFAFFVVPWMQEYGVQRGTLMLAATGSSVSVAILSPVCGYLLDRYDSKKLVLLSSLSFAAGLLGVFWAPNHLVIIFIFAVVLPVGMTLNGPLMAYSMVARVITEKRGFALGVAALGTSLGGLIMPFVIASLLGSFHWRAVFLILAGIVMIFVFLLGLLLLKTNNPKSQGGDNSHQSHTGSGGMLSRPVIQLGVAYLIPSMLFVAILHNIGALAADISISQKEAASVVSAASIIMAIGKLISGTLIDRLNHTVLYVGINLLIASGVVITSFFGSFIGLFVGVCLVASVIGGVPPLIASIVAERWGVDSFGRVMGVIHGFAAFAGVGPLIAGVIRDTRGSYSEAFLWLLVGLPLALWCFYTVPKVTEFATETEGG